MKVLICWSHFSGYMAACWRGLTQAKSVDLLVLARATGGQTSNTDFKSSLMDGIPHVFFPSDDPIDHAKVAEQVDRFQPDVVVINGWHTPAYVAITSMKGARNSRFIMAMDTPYQGTFRQRVGGLVMRRYFSYIDRVFVTGERCFQLARVLGFPETSIRRGVYGVDFAQLSPIFDRRMARPGGWPRRFLTTGRYAPEKAIDVLVDAYKRYRAMVSDPWPLTTCGKGPQASLLAGVEGIEDRGFIQPDELPSIFEEHGAFVLASRFDPWPLVIVEACAAGLPVVCTEACGSYVELVRFCFNGRTAATEDPVSLAHCLRWIHQYHHEAPQMGRASRELAAAYSAEMWVRRWVTTMEELLAEGPARRRA